MYFENTFNDIQTFILENKNKKHEIKENDIKKDNEIQSWKDIDFSTYTDSGKNYSSQTNKGNKKTSYSSKQRSNSDIEKGEMIQQKALKYFTRLK